MIWKKKKAFVRYKILMNFCIFIQHSAVELAFEKLSINQTVLQHITEIVEGSIKEKNLYFYFNRYIFSKDSLESDYTSTDLYVYKNDIGRIISLIANDIVSFALSKMVDKKLMKLCWDKKNKDFIFMDIVK